MSMPECGNPECKACKIEWKDGVRYVKCEPPKKFEPYVVDTLEKIMSNLSQLIHRLEDRSGLVP